MNSPEHQPPFEKFYDLNRLSEAGYEVTIELGQAERQKVAEWANVVGVNKFVGHVSLHRTSSSRFAYRAHLEAEIVQSCAVTLEPVISRISEDFTRSLHLVPHIKKIVDFSGELSPAAGDDEVPEEIDSPHFDLAAPLLEEFLLAIDPYPRAPGVEFDARRGEDEAPESPFAVLKGWKAKG